MLQVAPPSRLLRPVAQQFFLFSLPAANGSLRTFFSTSTSHKAAGSSSNVSDASKAAFNQRQILDELREKASQSASSSSLSNADAKPRFNATAEAALNAASGGRGGAMPLGMTGMSAGAGAGNGGGLIDKWTGEGKKWKDLKGGQKVARATVQSSRTVLIFGGAAVTFVIIYALSTELFAKNSPTVVFGDACKRVQKSPVIAQHLLPPYRFHTSSSFSTTSSFSPLNPLARGRRSRSVASYAYTDPKTGKEVMLLRFFVEARDKDNDLTLWDRTRQEIVEAGKWAGMKIQEAGEWVGDQLGLFEEDEGHDQASAFGSSIAKASSSEPSAFSRAWSFGFGSFTSLGRGGSDALRKLTSNKREPGTWSSGEAHAELEKDENGVLQYTRFFVDIPSSSATVRERLWVVRKPGDVER